MSENLNLIDTFAEFKEFKNIERESLMRILEDIFKQMLQRKYGADAHIDVIVNVDKGDVEFQRWLEIVEDGQITNESTQIELSKAVKIEPDFEVGEELFETIRLQNFGRRDIVAMRQSLVAKITEYEKELVYQKYDKKTGEIINGTVTQAWRKDVTFIDDDGVEFILPKTEQIPRDYYKKGDTVRAVILKVTPKTNEAPLIIASRIAPLFLERLMEEEIPEIEDGLISIRNIVRLPGERAKVAVEAYDDRIDPVGSCVGMKGVRIHGIVRELREENIDIIHYTTNANLYITRALSPAKITALEVNESNKTAIAYMKADQISLAIGKNGTNIKLANKLTGYEIDITRENALGEEDIVLQEFADEIDQWIIDTLKKIGCDTGKSVLELSREELIRRTDLEEETIDEVIRIIKEEFEK
ncbi:MAG: transcription termination factor NusA [Bacteroidales bacterium]|jgi:N utilization substance protein A|nr:transcription termination factor NusA [Bacteroidales bacterium]